MSKRHVKAFWAGVMRNRGNPQYFLDHVSWARFHVKLDWHPNQQTPQAMDSLCKGRMARVPQGKYLPVDWYFELKSDADLLRELEASRLLSVDAQTEV